MPPECEAYVRWLEHYARCKVFDAATRDRVLESIPQLRTAFSSGGSPSVKAARAQTCAHLLATDRQGAALVGCD